jgi:hypothetical protein
MLANWDCSTAVAYDFLGSDAQRPSGRFPPFAAGQTELRAPEAAVASVPKSRSDPIRPKAILSASGQDWIAGNVRLREATEAGDRSQRAGCGLEQERRNPRSADQAACSMLTLGYGRWTS